MIDVCGAPCKYMDAQKMLAALMHLFEELHIEHCGKEQKLKAATVGWPLLLAVQLATEAQLETEAQIRKLEEELKVRKVMWLVTKPDQDDKL